MTEADARSLVEGGETFTVEFKSETSQPLSDGELIEAVVCLANGDGGHLLVGVEDDGRVSGARPRHESGRTDLSRIEALVAGNTLPPVRVETELVSLDGRDVLVLTVPDAARVTGTGKGRYLRRAIGGDGRPACMPFHAHEMLAHDIERGAVDYARLDVPDAVWGDLDPLEFERLRRMVRENGRRADSELANLSDLDIAKALGVVTGDAEPGSIRVGALLLFGRDEALARLVPTHEIAFQVLRGTAVEVNEFSRAPLLRAADELLARFRARNTEEEIQSGLLRIGVPEYPEASFREAMANAMVHRDYTRLGAIHIQWRDESLEISNPGGFPAGVTVSNILVAAPNPRSPLLADAFKRIGIVERTGRGVDRIYEGQLSAGRGVPDYARSTADAVTVVLAGGPAALSLVRFVAEQADQDRPLSVEALLVIDELWHERTITTVRASSLTQVDEVAARRRLNRMVDAGLLEARGDGRRKTYHLSAAAYRAINEPAGYVRVHGMEPLRQEQMILSFVEAHGSITRGQVADLCQITSRRATGVLRRLVEQGALRMEGSRRTARYVLVDQKV